MKYISTRGQAEPVGFVDACLAGLAPDGGLYVPETFPSIAPAEPGESYVSVATRILSAMAGDALPEATVAGLCTRAYASFHHSETTPVKRLSDSLSLLELFHGPTVAFKDVAMLFIGQLYDHALTEQGRHLSVTCATSGDTGGAAAAAFAGSQRVALTILHPHERIAPIQRKFMTTTGAGNVQNLALTSDFDACQAIVKGLFADREFVADVGLSGVNSINWARIAAQMTYYAVAQAAVGPNVPIRFVVPSGNMGDALAGYVAARCGMLGGGLDIVCAVNENRALADILDTGVMRRSATVPTHSPAMDITVPSNFERLLFEAADRDADLVRDSYQAFAKTGEAVFPDSLKSRLGCMAISGMSIGNHDTLAEIRRMLDQYDELVCPHTAVGTAAAHARPSPAHTVVLATAHPAKFPEIVKLAAGVDAPLPDYCAHVADGEESFDVTDASLETVRDAVSSLAGVRV
ncbi:MAG: threonine synthase [Pseudomonadota bacterium]